jgi:DNA-directed RNA polymerase specialized sigma24 family protein
VPRTAPELDRELTEHLAGRAEDAVATLFDTYAERLHDYAATMLGGGQDAAELVHDTLVDATRRAPRLRDHRRLAAWLYAGVRLRLLKSHRSAVPVFYWPADVPQIRLLLRGVFGRLDHPEQETLLLTLRHGLDSADLAAVLGQTARATAGRLDTAVTQATAALAAEQLRLAGQCAGATSEVGEHILNCAGCLRRGHLTLADLLTTPVVHEMPGRLRGWVLHTATDPELDVYRADIAARGGGLTDAGLPRQPDAPTRLVRRSLKVTAKAATGSGTAMLASAVMVSSVMGIALLPILRAPSGSSVATAQSPVSGRGASAGLTAAPVSDRPAHTGSHDAPAPFGRNPVGTAPQPGNLPPQVQPPIPVPGQPVPSPVPTLPAPPGAPAPGAPAPAPAPSTPPWVPPVLIAPAPASTPGLTITTPHLPVQVSLSVLPPLKVQLNVQVPILSKLLHLLPTPPSPSPTP